MIFIMVSIMLKLAFKIGIGSAILLLLLLAGSLIYFNGINAAGIPNGITTTIAAILFICLFCAFALWIEAWVFILATWKYRSVEYNVLFVILMLAIWWLAAFYCHYLKNKTNRGNRSIVAGS